MKLSINEYKDKVRSYVYSCLKQQWINNEEAAVVLEQIDNDILTIGVVGQMKVGKSTLLNSLVFGNDILPTSEIPMTATLTYISYGEKFSAKVEMISESDFKEISEKKNMQPSENIEIEEIKAAKELYGFICNVPNYKQFFGKTIEVNPEQIDKYIGAEGEYTPLAKVVSLFVPDQNLKGINIVDTPGYNDPVSSRDMTTKKFLSQANVIICVQEVLSVFTKSDITLIKEQIPKSGIGKIVIAINKKDSVNQTEFTKIINRAENEKTRLMNDPNNDECKDLLSNCSIILVSSAMAMIARVTPDIFNNNQNLQFLKSQIEYEYPSLAVKDYLNESGILNLQQAVSDIVMNQKKDLILRAPIIKLSAFLNAYSNKCTLEKEHLEGTNELLSDKSIDLASVLADLHEFEKKAVIYTSEITSSCDARTTESIGSTTFSLRDNRDEVINSIKFEQKNSKKYLRLCFDIIENRYRELNITFSNKLRDLGNNISEILHSEVAKLERQLDQIVLSNSELIHKIVIKRIAQTINSNIPRTLGDNISLKAICPDYWGRQDVYELGIRRYFREMIEADFSNNYINTNTVKYEDIKTKLVGLIEKDIDQIIEDTRKQFNANNAKDIDRQIKANEDRIDMINKLIPQVESMIIDVNNLIKIN